MKRIYFYIRSYFGFSQREAKGFVVVLLIMVISIFLPFLTDLLPRESTSIQDQRMLDSITVLLNNATVIYPNSPKTASDRKEFTLTPFDPNTASQRELEALGIPMKVASRIINYRNKGGSFKKKTDLAKMYGLDKDKYNDLEPYILLPDSTPVTKYVQKIYAPKIINNFDINTCDSSDLDRLKGIGAVLSSRIIRYRDRLGGFVHADQYREIYGLDSTALKQLVTHCLIAEDFDPVKVNINNSNKEILSLHPYIGKKNASLIVNYRLQHGPYKSADDLVKIKVLKISDIEKMKEYLTFE